MNQLRNVIFVMTVSQMLLTSGAFMSNKCPNPITHGGIIQQSQSLQLLQRKLSSSPSSSIPKKRFNFLRRQKHSSLTTVSQGSMLNDLDVPRINVKPRPIVSLDESTGTYIPPSKQSPSTTDPSTAKESKQTKTTTAITYRANKNNGLSTGWNQFKDLVYDFVDSISNIISFFANNTKKNNSITDRTLAVAYSDTVEFKSQGNGGKSSILSEDQVEQMDKKRSMPYKFASSSSSSSSSDKVVRQYESSLKASSEDRSNGDDFSKSNTRRTFDAVKDGMYDFFSFGKKNDVPSETSSPVKKKSKLLDNIPMPTTTTTSSSESTKDASLSFKPASKPSTNKDDMVTSITPYLADLDSSNPIKVFKAKLAIASEERKRKKRIQDQKRKEAIDGAKTTVYNIIDSVQGTYNTITEIPKKIENAVEATEEVIEKTVEQTRTTAKEVQAIPSKIQLVVDDTKKSIEETKKATLEVVEEVKSIPQKVTNTVNEVKAIPQKVEQKVTETKQSIKETKEGVQRAVQKVEDLTYEAKVVAGLEKPKPKPKAPPTPPPPPPPKTTSQIAWSVAGTVAKATGKAAWFVGKGTVGLTVGAAKMAINSVISQPVSKPESVEETKVVKVEKKVVEKKIEKKEEEEVVVTTANTGASLLSKFSDAAKKEPEEKVELDTSVPTTVPSVTAEISVTPPLMDIGEIDPLLEKEVNDALKSAEEALDAARAAAEAQEKEEKDDLSTNVKAIDVNEALQKAKIAAAKARQDAMDLEAMLEKKKNNFAKS